LELAELLERSLEEPPIKRKTCLHKRKSLQETEKLQPLQEPSERIKASRFASYIALVSNINTEPSLFVETNKVAGCHTSPS
jgi:hypothetical protein